MLYLFFVLRHIGHVPASLSETYYLIQPNGCLFTAMMWTISFCLLPAMLDLTPDSLQFLAFLALAAICFVGTAPNFRQAFEGKVHTRAAWVAAIFGILWSLTATSEGSVMLVVSLMACLIIGGNTKTLKTCKVFWAEMVAFGTVYLSTLFMLL